MATSSSSSRPVVQERSKTLNEGDLVTDLATVNYSPDRFDAVQHTIRTFDALTRNGDNYNCQAVGRHFVITDVLWVDEEDKPVVSSGPQTATRVKFITTIKVNKEMCNSFGVVHGACLAFMFEMVTIGALVSVSGRTKMSINMNTSYFQFAPLGANLKVIGYTSVVGRNLAHLRGEIWDIDRSVLIASCQHALTDIPAPPKTKPARL